MSHILVVLQAVFLRWKVQFLRNFGIFIWHRNYIFCKEEKPFLHNPCAQGHDRRWIHSATHHITKKKYGRTNEFEVRNHNKQNWYPCLKYIQKKINWQNTCYMMSEEPFISLPGSCEEIRCCEELGLVAIHSISGLRKLCILYISRNHWNFVHRSFWFISIAFQWL